MPSRSPARDALPHMQANAKRRLAAAGQAPLLSANLTKLGNATTRDHAPARSYWMRVRQYGHTFQSALSGRWHVGQTLRTCVLQLGHTMKSLSMGVPHLGQMP